MKQLQYLQNPADFDNWAGLYHLLARSFAFMEGRIDPPSSFTRLTPELLAEKARDENYLLVFDGAVLVGCAFFRDERDALYVGKVAVDENYRRQGIMRAIMGRANALARRDGKSWLVLQVRVELVENIQAFGRLGFVKFGEDRHAGYDRTTSISMRKAVG